MNTLAVLGLLTGLAAANPETATSTIEPGWMHLRSGDLREWSEFPETPDGRSLERIFTAKSNAEEWTLLIRQQDVKQGWAVRVNGRMVGELVRDENPMVIALAIPAETLTDGENRLEIAPLGVANAASDDIRVGDIRLDHRPLEAALGETAVAIHVVDEETRRPTPCRITVVNDRGALQVLGNRSDEQTAVRPGVAYLARGEAVLRLPAGRYTIYAGRGFEYSLDRRDVTLAAGSQANLSLSLRREVPTAGYAACDTHVHTLTHSGHGDATISERMITIAGEGIELPVATDHNKQIDYEPLARSMELRSYFTPIVGNEVTTAQGHFNIFPAHPETPPPDHRQKTWADTFAEITMKTPARVAILNHARDLHSGVRPFDPERFNAVVAEQQEAWPELLRAMEVVNSGATQTDPLRLFRDWMAQLNRGRRITPVGCSDSHDVARHFIGQGRTYIRCDDRDPGKIDTDEVIDNFLAGRVMVSYGLLTELTVNGTTRSGDLAAATDKDWDVAIRILGPHWVRAHRLLLFANGEVIRDVAIPEMSLETGPPGVLWSDRLPIPRGKHDVHLVAIALGPGIDGLYWPTAKAYQPTSPEWTPHVLGCSGAVWLDNDGDGRPTSAREYAEALVARSPGEPAAVIRALAGYDQTVAAHAAYLLEQAGTSLTADAVEAALRNASPATQAGFRAYRETAR